MPSKKIGVLLLRDLLDHLHPDITLRLVFIDHEKIVFGFKDSDEINKYSGWRVELISIPQYHDLPGDIQVSLR